MKRYIYKPTGAVVTAPDGRVMMPELFGEVGAKPKARKKAEPEKKEASEKKEA